MGPGWQLEPPHTDRQTLTKSSVSCFVFPAVVGQAKLLPPERMKHSIKLVDDQMNWCDSAIEVLGGRVSPCLSFPGSHTLAPSSHVVGSTSPDSFQAVAAVGGIRSESSQGSLAQLYSLVKY